MSEFIIGDIIRDKRTGERLGEIKKLTGDRYALVRDGDKPSHFVELETVEKDVTPVAVVAEEPPEVSYLTTYFVADPVHPRSEANEVVFKWDGPPGRLVSPSVIDETCQLTDRGVVQYAKPPERNPLPMKIDPVVAEALRPLTTQECFERYFALFNQGDANFVLMRHDPGVRCVVHQFVGKPYDPVGFLTQLATTLWAFKTIIAARLDHIPKCLAHIAASVNTLRDQSQHSLAE